MKYIIALLVALSLLTPVAANAQFHEQGRPATLDFDQSAALARRFTFILNHTTHDYPRLHTQADLDNWTQEIVPFYGYEGIDNPDDDANSFLGIQYPSKISFGYYQNGEEHIHVLGTTNCLDNEVVINARYANPDSPLYNRPDALLTLTHELAHVQGICFGQPPQLDAEVSAQLSALEVLAAMVDKGNTLAFIPLVNELRDMSMASAWAFAMKEGRLDDYNALKAEITSSAFDLASYNKSERYWEGDPDQLQHILTSYNVVPLEEIVRVMGMHTCYYEKPEYPARHVIKADKPCIQGVALPIDQGVLKVPLFVDDLQYVWFHLDALAK